MTQTDPEQPVSNTLKIVARVRERTATGTDYAVAKLLGVNPSNFRRIMAGTGYLGEKAQRRAATLLGLPFDDVNALVNEDKAKTEEERSYWRSLPAARVRAALNAAVETTAALCVTAALILGPGIAPGHAAASIYIIRT